MPLRKASAVVVRALDYGEADRIVTFVTPDTGRLSGIAKGAKKSRRRFGAALELFTHVSLTYFEKPAFELVRLEGAEIVAGFPDARRDLTKITHASYLVEATGRAVQPREPSAGIFRLLVETLHAVDGQAPDETRLRAFELSLLVLLGYQPELRRCARCGRPRPATGRFRLSLKAGGLLCRGCIGDAPRRDADQVSERSGDARPVGRTPAGYARLWPPDDGGDLVSVSASLLDRLGASLDRAADTGGALGLLYLSPDEAAEARAFLPRFLSAQIGAEMKALKFLDGLADQPA